MKKSKRNHRIAVNNYIKSDSLHWIRRVIKEMKQNKRAQDFVLKTKLPL